MENRIVMFILGCCGFSIIAVMTSTFTMLVPAVISLLGVILGIMSLVNKLGGKGMAIAGIVLNVLSFFACLYMLVSFITLNKSIEEVSGYTIQELFQAVSSGEMTQEEYNDILMDAEEALMEME